MKTLLLITLTLSAISFTGCFNKHGISARYYSDCNEYYDLQGYYHKDCGKDDIITYDEIKKNFEEVPEKPKGNVY